MTKQQLQLENERLRKELEETRVALINALKTAQPQFVSYPVFVPRVPNSDPFPMAPYSPLPYSPTILPWNPLPLPFIVTSGTT